ncbi:hypothetical protein NTE09_001845 [Vibrio mimicus]
MKLLLRLFVLNLILSPSLTLGYTITSSNDHHCHEYKYNGDKSRIVKSCYSENNIFTIDNNNKTRSGYLTITYRGLGDISVNVEIFNRLGRKAFVHSEDVGISLQEIANGWREVWTFKFSEQNRSDNTQTLYINGESGGWYKDSVGVVEIKLGDGKEVELKYKEILGGESFCRISVSDAVGEMFFLQDTDISSHNSASVQYDASVVSNVGLKVGNVRFISGDRSVFKSKVLESERKIKENTNEIAYKIDSSDYDIINVSEHIEVHGEGVISVIPIVNLNKDELLAGKYSMRIMFTCN